MTRYSPEFKEQVVRKIKMMPPNNQSVARIHRETGISTPSLYAWKHQFQEKGCVVPAKTSQPDGWDNKAKLAAVIETALMNEAERSTYCRERGLYVEQLDAWKTAFEQASGPGTVVSPALLAERKKTHALEKELHRKEKALAEVAALLTLSKKAQAIWVTDEDA
jgi:transposase-like protein